MDAASNLTICSTVDSSKVCQFTQITDQHFLIIFSRILRITYAVLHTGRRETVIDIMGTVETERTVCSTNTGWWTQKCEEVTLDQAYI